jgi:ribose transport system permease protein
MRNKQGVFDNERIKEFVSKSGPLLALILLCIILSIASPVFLTTENLMNITRQASCYGLLALGMLVAILTAGIDLSVGASMALTSILMAKFSVVFGGNQYIGIIVCLGSGALLGLINGLLLTKLNLPHPFISTLGTQNIFRGLCLIITAATPISGMPPAIKWPGQAKFFNTPLPISIIIVVVAYVVFSIFLNHTVLGRNIYAVGGNPATARLSGVNVKLTLNMVYTISGFMCGFAGLLLAGRVDAVYPLAGLAWETDAIAAVIIGGASFFGGKGNVLGTFCGVMIIAVLRNGLNLLGVSPDTQTLILGIVIILAVYVDVLKTQREAKSARMAKTIKDESAKA